MDGSFLRRSVHPAHRPERWLRVPRRLRLEECRRIWSRGALEHFGFSRSGPGAASLGSIIALLRVPPFFGSPRGRRPCVRRVAAPSASVVEQRDDVRVPRAPTVSSPGRLLSARPRSPRVPALRIDILPPAERQLGRGSVAHSSSCHRRRKWKRKRLRALRQQASPPRTPLSSQHRSRRSSSAAVSSRIVERADSQLTNDAPIRGTTTASGVGLHSLAPSSSGNSPRRSGPASPLLSSSL